MPKSGLGKAVIFFIVGLSPLSIGVILVLIIKNELFESVIMSSCIVMGGFLDVFILKKEYGVRLQEKISPKIDIKLIFIVIILAVGYTITTGSTLNREFLIDVYGQNDYLTALDWMAVGLCAPVGEELVFRYAIFSSICDGNKKRNVIVAYIFSSFLFMINHLDNNITRNIDLFIFGIITAAIFYFSKNLIYNIVFHSFSNITIYSIACLFQRIPFNDKILLFSVPLLIMALALLILYFKNKTCIKKYNEMKF